MIGIAVGMAMFAVAEVPSGDLFGCKRIALDEKGKTVSLSVQGVDFSASPQFEMDAYAEDLSSLDGAIYLALIDGKGVKRRYHVCDFEAGHWSVMSFNREWDSILNKGEIDWRDIRKASIWVPACKNGNGTTVWFGNLRPAAPAIGWREPVKGERRFAWCLKDALGDGGDWKATAGFLSKWRFTDIIVQSGRAGGAYYDSSVVPRSKSCPKGRDPLREAIAACRAKGIRVHAMIASFRCAKGETPDDWREKFETQGLFQCDASGDQLQHHADRWLCPSDPRTAKFLVEVALELVEKIGVDGVQLDFIRYSTERMCYCPRCLKKFSEREGKTHVDVASIMNDPAVREHWLSFREDNISSVVKAVGDAMHASSRKAEFSVTCFPNAENDRAKVAQDYARWAREGWIDALFPMDYTPNTQLFRSAVSRQMRALAGTRTRLYPGIGICLPPFTAKPEWYVRHVNYCREQNLPGHAVYVLDKRGERFYGELEKSPFSFTIQHPPQTETRK